MLGQCAANTAGLVMVSLIEPVLAEVGDVEGRRSKSVTVLSPAEAPDGSLSTRSLPRQYMHTGDSHRLWATLESPSVPPSTSWISWPRASPTQTIVLRPPTSAANTADDPMDTPSGVCQTAGGCRPMGTGSLLAEPRLHGRTSSTTPVSGIHARLLGCTAVQPHLSQRQPQRNGTGSAGVVIW